MHKQVVHRLYTEDVNRQALMDVLAKHLTGLPSSETAGIGRAAPEQSLVIEVTGVSFADMARVAVAIKEANNQQAVLYTASEVKTRLF